MASSAARVAVLEGPAAAGGVALPDPEGCLRDAPSPRSGGASARTISVVVPAWQEAPLIAGAVRSASRIGDEVIVVDGGSADGTAGIAQGSGARVVVAEKGRGPQLRAGAAAAGGDVLLFLHADARLPPSARGAILAAMAAPEVVAGAFYIRFLPASWFTRLLEPASDLRRRLTRRTYGDTAIFVRAEVYRALGGHRPWPVMHDYELSGRLRRVGRWAYLREPTVWASARRFEGRALRTLALWLAIQGLYRVGVPPRWLARAYRDVRGGDPERFMALAAARIDPPLPKDRDPLASAAPVRSPRRAAGPAARWWAPWRR